jgi:hypothetical protein
MTSSLEKEAKTSLNPVRLLELAKDPQLSRLIAKRSNTPLDVRRALAKSSDMPTRAAVAKNHTTPLELLELLCQDPQWTVAKAVFGARVRRTVTPSRLMFERIAQHKRHTVRQTLAESNLCPADLLLELAQDPSVEVRTAVSENFNATPEMLTLLSKDPERAVLLGVVRHPNTPDDVLDTLAQHPDGLVRRYCVEEHLGYSRTRTIPLYRLELLANDTDRDVLEHVLWVKHSPTWLVEKIFAQNPLLFQVDCGFYVHNSSVYGSLECMYLERVLRQHSTLNPKWLEIMAQMFNPTLATVISQHVQVSSQILEGLTDMYSQYLEQHPTPDPTSSPEAQQLEAELIKRSKFLLCDLTLCVRLSQSAQEKILAQVQKTTLIPYSIQKLEQSPHDLVRQCLPELLDAMCQNHLHDLERGMSLGSVRYALAELCQFTALLEKTQKQILEFLSHQPLDSGELYRLRQSPHALVQAAIQGQA